MTETIQAWPYTFMNTFENIHLCNYTYKHKCIHMTQAFEEIVLNPINLIVRGILL
jgi:hypothetical protein